MLTACGKRRRGVRRSEDRLHHLPWLRRVLPQGPRCLAQIKATAATSSRPCWWRKTSGGEEIDIFRQQELTVLNGTVSDGSALLKQDRGGKGNKASVDTVERALCMQASNRGPCTQGVHPRPFRMCHLNACATNKCRIRSPWPQSPCALPLACLHAQLDLHRPRCLLARAGARVR